MQPVPSILFVTRKWAPAVGGMELYSQKLAEALQSITPLEVVNLPGEPDGKPPPLWRLPGFAVRAAWRILARSRPLDVLHLGDMVLWPLGLVARLRSCRTKVVLSAHGTDVAFHRRGGVRGRAYATYLRAGAALLRRGKVLANSEATREVARETGWSRFALIPLAADSGGPEPTGEHNDSLLFVGRLVERKGCAWFIRHVLPLLPNDRLRVAGTGWDEAEIRALDHSRVQYLGILRGAELARAYRQAKCVVVPNIEPQSGEFEGFGLVATEAAAAGGLVLAARTGGLTMAILDGETGIAVRAGDPEAWANAISQLSSWQPDQRRAFLQHSMRKCRDYYSWARVASDTLHAYGIALQTPLREPDPRPTS